MEHNAKKLHAQTFTSWTLCIDLTVNPANRATLAACVLGDLHRKKGQPLRLTSVLENGRDDRIRTCGLFVPNEARYQTVPHPDNEDYYTPFTRKMQALFLKYLFCALRKR